MIRYKVIKDARILFIGINPHYGSFDNGVPFSNNKTFWYLLDKSGVIDEKLEDIKDNKRLKDIYMNKFSKFYRLSLLNLINRPSRDVTQLKRGEELDGRKYILTAIKRQTPKVVCFIGKVTFKKFSGETEVKFGWQKKLFGSDVYVMHFPVRGEASIRLKELRAILKRT